MKTPSQPELVDFEVAIPNAQRTKIVERITIRVPIERDPITGEKILTTEALDLIESTQARHMGLMLPEEIKSVRLSLGLTQRQFGELLQVGEKTATRLENGRGRPSRSMNVLLCALRDFKLPLVYLETLHQPVGDWWSSAFEEPLLIGAPRPSEGGDEADEGVAADHQNLALAA